MSEQTIGDLSTTTSINYTLSDSTLPSDKGTLISLTSSSTTDFESEDNVSKITAHMIEKKQLIHEVDRLRIELSEKNLLVETYKAELLNKIDELEEKVTDLTYSKHMLKAKLESQIKLQEEEGLKQKTCLKQEISTIIKRQHSLEAENLRLQQKAGDLKMGLFDSRITETQYINLKSTDTTDLSLKDYVAVHFFEATQPLKIQCDSLQQRVGILAEEMSRKEEELAVTQKELDEERQARAEQDFMIQKLTLKVEELQCKTQNKDFKSQNYDRVLSDRQEIERETMELRKKNVMLETSLENRIKEIDDLTKEFQCVKQSLALLKQDNGYLNKQHTELSSRCKIYEQQVVVLNQELSKTKEGREDIYEKYISVRERYKSEYEMKLKSELDEITTKTHEELEKIKINTKEMYERENRNLREAKDNALAEKERAVQNEQNMKSRYEQVVEEFRQLQSTSDGRITELQAGIKLKQFEFDRLQIVYEETSHNLKQLNIDNAQHQNKLQIINKEFYALQASTDKQINELQIQCADATKKLSMYEKLEQELDDVILQAAELQDEVDAEKVLFAYGYGANVPSTAKRRMQQSVHLARRVLKLEKTNTSLQQQLGVEKKKKDQLMQELTNSTNILNEAQQPYNYLIESIRSRDEDNKSLREQNNLLEQDLRKLQDERDQLAESKNQIAADLERLLNHREELGVMKNVILGLKGRDKTVHGNKEKNIQPTLLSKARKTEKSGLAPEPTQFTKPEKSSWYDKLKTRN